MTTVTEGRASHSREVGNQLLVDHGLEGVEQVGLEPHQDGIEFSGSPNRTLNSRTLGPWLVNHLRR